MMATFSLYNELRLDRKLCDAVIEVDSVEFLVHKIILCKCSTYFRTLFIQESTPERRVFNIPHVSPEMMKIIIEFAYTGIVPVTSENVHELFLGADRFIVEGIIKACSDFMEQMLEPQNCIGIWRFTDFFYLPEVRDKAFLFLLNHFEEVVTTEEFLSLSAQKLVHVIKSDQLIVTKESKVYEATLRWIAHAPEERRKHLPQLLSNVRLALMSPDYFRNNVAANELVKANRMCQPIVSNTLHTMAEIGTSGNSFSVFGHPLARHRLPAAILFAVGGLNGIPINAFGAYDVHADRWVNVSDGKAGARAYHGTAYLDGSIYRIGGFTYGAPSKSTVSRFHLVTHRWLNVAPMHSERYNVSVTVMDGFIYAVGGYDEESCLASAERYLPSTNQWTVIAPMNESRSGAGCASFCGKVYICGGSNENEVMSTAECYNPETNQWTQIAEMSTRRGGVGVIASAEYIFAVGGYSEATNILRSVEVYDPDSDTWHHVAPMPNPRSNFGIGLIDDHLFVVGGFNGRSNTCEVQRYDVNTNEWSKVCGMATSCRALSCCVASGFPNLAEYAVPHPHDG